MQNREWLRLLQAAGWMVEEVVDNGAVVRCPIPGCTTRQVATQGHVPAQCDKDHAQALKTVAVRKFFDLRDELRKRRRKLRLSQEDVDYISGLTVGHCAKLEADYRRPTLPMLIMWAESLGCSLTLVESGFSPLAMSMMESKLGRAQRGKERESLKRLIGVESVGGE